MSFPEEDNDEILPSPVGDLVKCIKEGNEMNVFAQREERTIEPILLTARQAGKPIATWIHDTLAQLLKGE